MHAHVSQGGVAAAENPHRLSADIHSGHSHDVSSTGTHDFVVDLDPTLTSQSSGQFTFWSHWLPLGCAVVLFVLVAQLCIGLFSPLKSSPAQTSQRGHWRPPLRGPPAFSI